MERSISASAKEAARTSLSSGTRHRRCRCCLPALTGFTTGRRGETDAGHHDCLWRRGRDCSRPDGRSSLASRSEEHTSELQSPCNLVCRLLLEKKNRLKLTQASFIIYNNILI